jgi:hypothetical protein
MKLVIATNQRHNSRGPPSSGIQGQLGSGKGVGRGARRAVAREATNEKRRDLRARITKNIYISWQANCSQAMLRNYILLGVCSRLFPSHIIPYACLFFEIRISF